MTIQHLRIARPVTDLALSSHVWCHGLGLQNIGGFTGHQGFSGVMLGADGLGWHLEFTHCPGHPLLPAFNPYWDRQGVTFSDQDGYRVVIQHAAWPPQPL